MSIYNRDFLRHTIATVAYRGEKAIRTGSVHFGQFKVGETTRTPVQILAHIGDLFDWGLSIARGEERWKDSEPLDWKSEVERFFTVVKKFDDFLASDEKIHAPLEKLFQGPIADALQHIGQINLLRRLAGDPTRGENYYRAVIEKGTFGVAESQKRIEFD